jgi:hypothetical protein
MTVHMEAAQERLEVQAHLELEEDLTSWVGLAVATDLEVC